MQVIQSLYEFFHINIEIRISQVFPTKVSQEAPETFLIIPSIFLKSYPHYIRLTTRPTKYIYTNKSHAVACTVSQNSITGVHIRFVQLYMVYKRRIKMIDHLGEISWAL